jgi:hypothetical protein
MAITIRLGKEEEQKLRAALGQPGGELSHGVQAVTRALREAFRGVDAIVRVEGEDGELIVADELPAGSDWPRPWPPDLEEDLARIDAAPREPGAAFGFLAGKGDPDAGLHALPFREQVAAAAASAAVAREDRLCRGDKRGGRE